MLNCFVLQVPNNIMSGRFITFEGGEGAGKTTQIKALTHFLSKMAKETLCTREPGGTPMAEALRDLVTLGPTGRWSALEEMLIMYTARSELVRTIIKPKLEEGVWVLSDRFADSTTVYQGFAGGVPLDRIRQLHSIVLGEFAPDLTIILDLPPDEGLRRVNSRAQTISRFEKHPAEFYQKVRNGYLQIANENPDRCAVVDAGLPIGQISEQICQLVADKFNNELTL